MKRRSKKQQAKITASQPAKDDFKEEHPTCWACRVEGVEQISETELHHIGGKRHPESELRANYAALCNEHHNGGIYSIHGASSKSLVVALALKSIYDGQWHDLAKVLEIKALGPEAVTEGEIQQVVNLLMDGATVAEVIKNLLEAKK